MLQVCTMPSGVADIRHTSLHAATIPIVESKGFVCQGKCTSWVIGRFILSQGRPNKILADG